MTEYIFHIYATQTRTFICHGNHVWNMIHPPKFVKWLQIKQMIIISTISILFHLINKNALTFGRMISLFITHWMLILLAATFILNSPHKDRWRGALMSSLICEWTNGWVNNREAGDFRCHRAHYDDIVIMMHLLHVCAFTMGQHM